MKPQPILPDMPYHIKQIIVRHADLLTKMGSLIRCSKEFKELVENCQVQYDSVSVLLNNSVISEFAPFPEGRKRMMSHFCARRGQTDHFIHQAVDQLLQFVRNPNCSLREISIDMDQVSAKVIANADRFFNRLKNSLSTLNHQLAVETLTLRISAEPEYLLSIIPHLKPETLQKIDIYSKNGDIPMDRIAVLEQWKRARVLNLKAIVIGLPYSWWKHFEECSVRIGWLTQTVVFYVVENFKHDSNIHKTRIESWEVNSEEIKEFLGQFEKIGENWHIEVPEENQYLEVFLGTRWIMVTRYDNK